MDDRNTRRRICKQIASANPSTFQVKQNTNHWPLFIRPLRRSYFPVGAVDFRPGLERVEISLLFRPEQTSLNLGLCKKN